MSAWDERGRWVAEYASEALGTAPALFEELVEDAQNLDLLAAFLNGGPAAPQSLLIYTGKVEKAKDPSEDPPESEPSAVASEPSEPPPPPPPPPAEAEPAPAPAAEPGAEGGEPVAAAEARHLVLSPAASGSGDAQPPQAPVAAEAAPEEAGAAAPEPTPTVTTPAAAPVEKVKRKGTVMVDRSQADVRQTVLRLAVERLPAEACAVSTVYFLRRATVGVPDTRLELDDLKARVAPLQAFIFFQHFNFLALRRGLWSMDSLGRDPPCPPWSSCSPRRAFSPALALPAGRR